MGEDGKEVRITGRKQSYIIHSLHLSSSQRKKIAQTAKNRTVKDKLGIQFKIGKKMVREYLSL